MKLLFNKPSITGQVELKKLLGFLDADFNFENLETDIYLNTPSLVEFIGHPMYDKLVLHYEEGPAEDSLDAMLRNAQLFIAISAYLEYSSNGDIIHGNTGRKIHFAENEKTPWDWQINMDNAALKRRSYKALDRLIALLDGQDYPEWKNSDQYKKAAALFLYNTQQLQNCYPINNSGQLYYRLVPFMADVETETLLPILGTTQFNTLKSKIRGALSTSEMELMAYCQKITAFHVLERATMLLPEEMMDVQVNYRLSDQEREGVREKRALRFLDMARKYEVELQRILARQNAEEYTLNQTHGIVPGKNHVNL